MGRPEVDLKVLIDEVTLKTNRLRRFQHLVNSDQFKELFLAVEDKDREVLISEIKNFDDTAYRRLLQKVKEKTAYEFWPWELLREKAKSLKVLYYSRLDKSELIQKIRELEK